MKRRLAFVPIGLLLFLGAVALPGAQSPQATPPTFQLSVNYVDVDVTVTDAQGNFVSGLTRDDFQVFEDGKSQKIDAFSYFELPIEPQKPDRLLALGGGARAVPFDVRSNSQASAGRVYLIVLDDLDVSPLRTSAVRQSARTFVEKYFGANDVGAVVCTTGISACAQEFTSDPALLLSAISKFVGRRMESAEVERIDAYYAAQLLPPTAQQENDQFNNPGQPQPDPEQATLDRMQTFDPFNLNTYDPSNLERGQRALGVMDSMRRLAEFLANVRGRRKALLLFSEGLDYPMSSVFDSQSGNEIIRATEDAISAAAQANLNFYTLDPRGLIGMTTDLLDMYKQGPPDYAGTQNGQPMPGQQALMDEMRLSQDSLRTLAEETGGFALINSNSFTDAFDRIVQSNSRYYLMGYTPPTHPRDGRFHKIEVRVKRPGLKVTARKGYPSPRGKTPEERKTDDEAKRARESKKGGADNTSAELRDLLNSPMQQAGLVLSVQAAPFKNTLKEASVALAIELDGSRLQFASKNNNTLFTNNVEFSLFSLSDQGNPQRGARAEAGLSLLAQNYQRVRALGIRANQRIALAPGRYQVRVAARESVGGQTGSVFYDLVVPDFTKDPLMMSGLLLSSIAAQQVFTAQHDPAVEKALLAPATTRRAFAQNDTLALVAEIYDNIASRQPRQIDVGVHLLGEDGREVLATRDTLANGASTVPGPGGAAGAAATDKNWDTFSFTRQIALKDVPPGRYLLRVDAQVRGSAHDAKPAASETVITVLPAL